MSTILELGVDLAHLNDTLYSYYFQPLVTHVWGFKVERRGSPVRRHTFLPSAPTTLAPRALVSPGTQVFRISGSVMILATFPNAWLIELVSP